MIVMMMRVSVMIVMMIVVRVGVRRRMRLPASLIVRRPMYT